MALALLDGTTAAVDFTVPTTPGGTATSLKNHAGYFSLSYQRATQEKITFGSQSWMTPSSSIRRGSGHADMFATTGSALSGALVLLLQDLPLPFTFTADTGNTIGHASPGGLMVVNEAYGVRAFGEFARGLDWITAGAPTIVWVVT